MARSKGNIVVMNDFPGYMNNVDPHQIPDGAASEQINLVSAEMGSMKTRDGFRPLTFANTTLTTLD